MPVSKNLVISKFGNPCDVLEIREETLPDDLKNDEVLVKVLYSPINPADNLTILGLYPAGITEFPHTPGFEGVVEVVKSAVSEFATGDHALVGAKNWGKWRQFGILNKSDLIKIPKELPTEIAATLVVNPLTAYLYVEFALLNLILLHLPLSSWLLE